MRRLLAVCLVLVLLLVQPLGAVRADDLSKSDEILLGRQMLIALRQSRELVGDRVLDDYVSRVGDRLLAAAGGSVFKVRFYLIKDLQMNAFAAPGGVICVTTGLIEQTTTVDELAGVLGHELGHSLRRHIASRLENSKRINMAMLAGILAGVAAGVATGNAGLAGAGIFGSAAAGATQELAYSREQEIDADRLGSNIMAKAGYDTHGTLELLETMDRIQSMQGVEPPAYLSTHPGLLNRIAFLKSNAPPDKVDPNRVGASDFDWFMAQFMAYKGNWRYFEGKKGQVADYGRALQLLSAGQLAEALAGLEMLHGMKPHLLGPTVSYAQCLRQMGRIDQAVTVLNKALKRRPECRVLQYYLGTMYIDQNRPAQATEVLEDLLEARPDDPEVLRYLSIAYGRRGELFKAHMALAWSSIQMGRVKEAMRNFDLALKHAATADQKNEVKTRRTEALELAPAAG